jgi:hypothetical protein
LSSLSISKPWYIYGNETQIILQEHIIWVNRDKAESLDGEWVVEVR